MSLVCSISGEVPKEPVVTRTGHLFEKSLIVEYINANGKCPVTNEPLSESDLVPLKNSKIVKPRPITATSIPSLLQLFQNEWDAIMLESFQLKQHLESVRQELAHALYQHDAACRVIARLIKERDTARNALATAQAQLAAVGDGSKQGAESMDVDQPKTITDEIKHQITQLSKKLTTERKNRTVSPTLVKPNELKEYSLKSSHPIHAPSTPHVHCVDIHPTEQSKILTGGADKTVVLFNRQDDKKLAVLKGHSRKVSGVLFHPTQDILFSCSHDKTAIVWSASSEAEDGYAKAHILKAHTGAVVGITLQATNDYVATASSDCSWAFHDVSSGSCLAHITHESNSPITAIKFHPDGVILTTGCENNVVRIWDIKTQANVFTFEGHTGKISALAFSENGYYLATAAADSTVKLWDLRKLKSFHSITLEKPANALDFDYSGSYLAVGGSNISFYSPKTAEHISSFDNPAVVSGLKFGTDAKYLAVTSLDRNLRFYGV